jgi:hypothetical protein
VTTSIKNFSDASSQSRCGTSHRVQLKSTGPCPCSSARCVSAQTPLRTARSVQPDQRKGQTHQLHHLASRRRTARLGSKHAHGNQRAARHHSERHRRNRGCRAWRMASEWARRIVAFQSGRIQPCWSARVIAGSNGAAGCRAAAPRHYRTPAPSSAIARPEHVFTITLQRRVNKVRKPK